MLNRALASVARREVQPHRQRPPQSQDLSECRRQRPHRPTGLDPEPRASTVVGSEGWSFLYGSCELSGSDHPSCAPPLQIQVDSTCKRWAGALGHTGELFRLRGAKAHWPARNLYRPGDDRNLQRTKKVAFTTARALPWRMLRAGLGSCRGSFTRQQTPQPVAEREPWPARRLEPLVPGRQPPLAPRLHHALGVRVPPLRAIVLRRDQHMLRHRSQVLPTKRTAVRGRLQILRRPHRPPPRFLHHPATVWPHPDVDGRKAVTLLATFRRDSVSHEVRIGGSTANSGGKNGNRQQG